MKLFLLEMIWFVVKKWIGFKVEAISNGRKKRMDHLNDTKTWILALCILFNLTCYSASPRHDIVLQIPLSGTYQSELIEDFYLYIKFYKDGLVLLKVVDKTESKEFKSLEYQNNKDPKLGFGRYEKSNDTIRIFAKNVLLEYKFEIISNENDKMVLKHLGSIVRIPDTIRITKIFPNDELGNTRKTLDLYEKNFEYLSGIFYMSVYACDACHSLYTSERIVGPPLKDLYLKKRKLQDGREVLADRDYLKRSVLSPGEGVVEGYVNLMPVYTDTFQKRERELNLIVETMMKL
ncbi:hypothetical protein AB3N60_06045 [Leptospira sp. WS39.C2]